MRPKQTAPLRLPTQWIAILFAMLLCRPDAVLLAQSLRTVHVTVTLTRPDGSHVQDIAFRAYGSNGRAGTAYTNATGVATLAIQLPSTDRAVWLLAGGGVDDPVVDQRLANSSLELSEQLCYQGVYVVPLQDGQVEYTLTPSLNEYVELRGRVITAEGDSVKAGASAVCMTTRSSTDEFRYFVRVPKNAPAQFYVMADGRPDQCVPVIVRHTVTAQQTSQSDELDPIVLPTVSACGSASIRLSRIFEFQEALDYTRRTGCTLVSADGTRVFTFAGHAAQVDGSIGAMMDVPVPAGSYYLAPGVFGAFPDQLALIEAIERGDDLSNSGVPIITIVAGQTATLSTDMMGLYQKVAALIR